MIRQVSIRRGRTGTHDTLELIYGMGLQGSTERDVQQFVRSFPASQWDGLLRQFWQFEEEETETLRSVRLQADYLRRSGVMIGDCDDAAVVAVALGYAYSPNIELHVVAVRSPASHEFEHVFVEIGNLRIDPTAPVNADYRNWERMVYP